MSMSKKRLTKNQYRKRILHKKKMKKIKWEEKCVQKLVDNTKEMIKEKENKDESS